MCPLCEPFHQGIDLRRARESARIKPTLLHQVHKRVHAEKKLRSGAALAVADAKVRRIRRRGGRGAPEPLAARWRLDRGSLVLFTYDQMILQYSLMCIAACSGFH